MQAPPKCHSAETLNGQVQCGQYQPMRMEPHPAMLPHTEQNFRGLAVVGGPTAAVR